MDGDYEVKEYCKRCGTQLFPFNKKYSASAHDFFCAKCSEKFDREYLIKNSCAICGKLLKPDDVKIVLPSHLFAAGPIPVQSRLACAECNKKFAGKQRDRKVLSRKIDIVRDRIRKSIARKMVEEKSSTFGVF